MLCVLDVIEHYIQYWLYPLPSVLLILSSVHKSFFTYSNYRRPEKLAILISRLLLHIRGMCVDSVRLDFHLERMERVWTFYHSLSDHPRFDPLQHEIYTKHSVYIDLALTP